VRLHVDEPPARAQDARRVDDARGLLVDREENIDPPMVKRLQQRRQNQ